MESSANDDAYSNHFFSVLLLAFTQYFLSPAYGLDGLVHLFWCFFLFLLELSGVALVQGFFGLFGEF